MKTTASLLTLGLLICLGFMVYQGHRFSVQSERQERAIALVQARCDAALAENRSLKQKLQQKADTSEAYASAKAIAARYRSLPKTSKSTAAR